MEFKKSDRVISMIPVGNNGVEDAMGIVLYIKTGGNICVQFDNYINGHDGGDFERDTGIFIRGKSKYCWYMSNRNLKLININKRIS